MTSAAGYNCAYCGTWLSGTEMHWCEKMHPNWNPSWNQPAEAFRIDPSAPGQPLDRIADALQRIAAALESNRDISEGE
jgi:hypothetical protein